MKIYWNFLLFGVMFLLYGCAASTNDLKVVENFDAARFGGTWYELARKPHTFEEGMSNVSAHYECLPNGKVKVTNTGYEADTGNPEFPFKKRIITGSAKFAESPDIGYLRVTFFWPFYGDYKVLDLAPDYSTCIVTSGSMDYLWILARKPYLSPAEMTLQLQKAALLGFDLSDIIMVKQDLNYMYYNAAFMPEANKEENNGK